VLSKLQVVAVVAVITLKAMDLFTQSVVEALVVVVTVAVYLCLVAAKVM
jgi:hypothetical protein